MIMVRGGVTAPKGFMASGLAAGIKRSGRKDMALLYSDAPAVAAAAFTSNRFQASPIKVSKLHLKNATHRAIIVNSGNANCANGKSGDRDASMMTEYAAGALGLNKKEVLAASTGIIGQYLPMEKIRHAMPALVGRLSRGGSRSFAGAIMTTDTKVKERAVKVKISGRAVTIGGACKGVGMIHPDMKASHHATMLAFLTTDAAITKAALSKALDEALAESFNMISVDGDMSTNDSCFILANSRAGNRIITRQNHAYGVFTDVLRYVTQELAKDMVRDGEGATKLVEIDVVGARDDLTAKRIARRISASNLLKCCVYGGDPNWGRVAAACGASSAVFDPDRVDIYIGGIKVMSRGASVKDYDRAKAKKIFDGKVVPIKVDLRQGGRRAKAWTCDLSKEYVEINSEYST